MKKGILYCKYIFLALVTVGIFFALQVHLVLQEFKPVFAVVPILLAVTIGILAGRIAVLGVEIDRQKRLLHTIAHDSHEFTCFRNLAGRYEYVSSAVTALTGYEAEDFFQKADLFDSLVHPEDRKLWQGHVHRTGPRGKPEVIELRIIHKDGSLRWIEHICSPVELDGEFIGIRSANIDITRRKEQEGKISHLANHDALTGLPNRRSLHAYLERLISRCGADKKRFAVLFIDLDRFKYINDTLGHSVGDALLLQVAGRLGKHHNHSFICRFGGDEFVQVVPEMHHQQSIEELALARIRQLQSEYAVDDYSLYISASVGVAVYPDNGASAEILLKNADFAMYDAKRQGSGHVSFYSSLGCYQMEDTLFLEKRLRDAIAAKQLDVVYQPKVDQRSNTICSCEALVRWVDNGASIPPASFIQVAEDTGAIIALGRLVIEKVFCAMARWRRNGLRPPRVAFNVSPRELSNEGFVEYVASMLKRFELSGDLFEIEITENFILQNNLDTISRINQLRKMGFAIVLDDFGTGYSSLSYLHQYRFDILKIDRAFVRDLSSESSRLSLVKMIITLGRELGMEVVAEGVENESERDQLLQLGCSIFQGFLFYRPMAEGRYEKLIGGMARGELMREC